MDVSVEVGVLAPAYTVRATVKDALDFLTWIQKNIDKAGKHVLCADTVDFNSTQATNLPSDFNATVATNLEGGEDDGGDGEGEEVVAEVEVGAVSST